MDVRLFAVFVRQLLFDLHGAVRRVAHGTADAHGVVVAQKAFHFAGDHRHAVGGEHYLVAWIEIIDGLDEPDAAHLKEVIRVFAAACKALDDTEHQT